MTQPQRPTQPEHARTLAAQAKHATLATLDRRDQSPHATLVEVAGAPESGAMLLLLSELAEHTQNLLIDARASLLLTSPWHDPEPLSRPRVTLQGHITRSEDPQDLATFLKAHPGAAQYSSFKDFHMYRFAVSRARFIAGFGRMSWIEAGDYAQAAPDPLGPMAVGALTHMNEDHAHNLLDYAHKLAGLPWAKHARMTGLDRLGFDLHVTGDDGQVEDARLSFDAPLTSPAQVRPVFVDLAKRSRGA